jgi:Flp pilus assembly protein TadG
MRKQGGQSLTEFALVLPVLMLLVIAVLDFGRAVYAYSVVANAAREGARFACVAPNDSAGAVAAATAAAIGLDVARLTVTFSRPDSSSVRVLVSYDFQLITPLIANVLGGSGLTLRSTATMYVGY